MGKIDLDLTINDQKVYRRQIEGSLWLNDFLREELGMTGTKFCCGIAVCRVCTVAWRRVPSSHWEPIRSCTTPVEYLNGTEIKSVEGLATGDKLHPLQESFLENFAFQCGYSAPGFLMGAYCLLDRLSQSPVPKADVDAVIEDAVGEHICRCTGYVRYYRAIKQVVLATPGLTT